MLESRQTIDKKHSSPGFLAYLFSATFYKYSSSSLRSKNIFHTVIKTEKQILMELCFLSVAIIKKAVSSISTHISSNAIS